MPAPQTTVAASGTLADLTPRQVRLADAGLRLLLLDPSRGMTPQGVAEEAGLSPADAVAALPTERDLFAAMVARERESAVSAALAVPVGPLVRLWLVRLTLEALPLDKARRAREQTSLALMDCASRSAAAAAALADNDRRIISLVTDLVQGGIATGEIADDVDADAAARLWWTLLQGWSTQLMYAPQPEREMEALVHLAIAGLLPEPRG